LDKNKFKIELKDDSLFVKYDEDKKNGDNEYLKKEFDYSTFEKSFSLPEDINYDKITSEYLNGILYIDIPKDKTKNKNKIIKIK
jgi:HSP20 family protein